MSDALGLQGRGWLGSDAAARRDLLTRVQALLPAHVVLPEARLEVLVEQALRQGGY